MKRFERVDRFDKQDDKGRRWIYMCHSGGYVMAKHPKCMPKVFTLKEWAKLDKYEKPATSVVGQWYA